MKQLVVSTLSVITLAACGSTQSVMHSAERPMVASLQPNVGALPEPQPEASSEPVGLDQDAGFLLERGISLFRDQRFTDAADAFAQAIATGQLNSAGRALAYWHVYIGRGQAGDKDASADALTSFVVVADEVLEARGLYKYAVTDDGDFVARFGLADKVVRARATLSASWASRQDKFGRQAVRPVPVNSQDEMAHFLALVAPCDSELDRESISRRVISTGEHGELQRVVLTCGASPSESFFFEMKGPE